jgi:hypothetical protein
LRDIANKQTKFHIFIFIFKKSFSPMAIKKGKLKHQFINPWFDRFVANAMMAPVTHKAMGLLHAEDQQALMSRDDFIAFRSLEDKLLLLSKLGYPFALVVGAPNTAPNQTMLGRIVSVFFKALAFKRQDALRVMREKFFFVMSDTEFLKGLKLASNVLHSPASANLPGYSYVSEMVYQYKYTDQQEHMKSQYGAEVIDGIILQAMQLTILSRINGFKAVYGIDDRQYLVMAYVSKQKEVSLHDLTVYTGKMRNLSLVLSSLVTLGYLETKRVVARGSKAEAVPHYWITGMGEHVLNKARNFFIN